MDKYDIFYMFREDNMDSYTITKWREGETMPIADYKMRIDDKNRIWCSCPSGTYRKYCHHTQKLRLWIADGKPEYKSY